MRAEEAFYRRFDEGAGVSNSEAGDEQAQWLWTDADWRKWEAEEPWAWQPAARQRWAEDLFSQQMARRLERARFIARQKSGAERQAADAEREAARARRFGAAGHHSHHHAGASAGAAGRARRRRDFLGYYKMLGIESAEDGGPEAVGTDEVKAAYKRTALELHPDRHVGADEPTRRRLADRFSRAQRAYETLKDPERRKQYDRGQLVSGG